MFSYEGFISVRWCQLFRDFFLAIVQFSAFFDDHFVVGEVRNNELLGHNSDPIGSPESPVSVFVQPPQHPFVSRCWWIFTGKDCIKASKNASETQSFTRATVWSVFARAPARRCVVFDFFFLDDTPKISI